MRTLHKRSLMPAAIGATAIAWIARVLSGRLVADRGDRSDSGDYMRTSLKLPDSHLNPSSPTAKESQKELPTPSQERQLQIGKFQRDGLSFFAEICLFIFSTAYLKV